MDIDALVSLLAHDAILVADGGGLASAALRPIEGAEQIVRSLLRLAGKRSSLTILERTVNGQPGLVAQQNGVTVTVAAPRTEETRPLPVVNRKSRVAAVRV